jgi:chemotaxis protein CheY-P-specific phosphatase CheC
MPENLAAIEAVSNALETMAFVSAWPCEGTPEEEAPDDPVLAAIGFRGGVEGRLELVAPRQFARVLAMNLLGVCEPDAPTDEQALDALRELLNVACGAILRARRVTEAKRFEMSIPWIEELDGARGWSEFAARPGTVILDADGSRIAFRFVEEVAG